MSDIFMLLVLLSMAGFLVALVRPQWLRMPSRKMSSLVFGGATILFFIGFGVTSPSVPAQPATAVANAPIASNTATTTETPHAAANTAPQPQAKPDTSKADAQKELDDLMALGIKAKLVKSYALTQGSEDVVYVDAAWYSQTVSFKRDFVAKVGALKEKATGYHHFEVRDAYSNEKLAEYTAFLGSVEVYR